MRSFSNPIMTEPIAIRTKQIGIRETHNKGTGTIPRQHPRHLSINCLWASGYASSSS
jgi:hypothetical protein